MENFTSLKLNSKLVTFINENGLTSTQLSFNQYMDLRFKTNFNIELIQLIRNSTINQNSYSNLTTHINSLSNQNDIINL